MQGVLFRYGPAPANLAFHSGPVTARRHVVLIAGLTEGLDALPYARALHAAAAARGYALVQAQLRSSYGGWGVGALDEDARDLLDLLRCLAAGPPIDGDDDNSAAAPPRLARSEGVVLMGHWTGAQGAVRFAARCDAAALAAAGAPPLLGVVLQGPVSDREWLHAAHPDLAARLPEAQAFVLAGRGEEVVCRAADDLGSAPLSAARLVALVKRLGDDDMFSTDLSPEELSTLLGHLAPTPLLLLQSGDDEAAPDRASIAPLGTRLMAAAASGGGGGEAAAAAANVVRRHIVLEGAPHNAAGYEAAVAAHVGEFLAALEGDSARSSASTI